MKKTVSIILVFVLVCTSLFALTSCGSSQSDIDAATAPLNLQIEALTNRINEAELKIYTLEEEKESLMAEITGLNFEISILEAEKAILNDNIVELESEIERITELMDGNSVQLIEKINNLENEKKIIEARVLELENDISQKNTEIVSLNLIIDTLTSEKNNLIAEKNNLIAENNALKAENDAIKKENEELKAFVEALCNCAKGIHTCSNSICTVCGTVVAYVRDGDYIYFGEYPQTLKESSVAVSETTDSRGYYLGSDGAYYAKVTATPYQGNYTFSTGESVNEGNVYYFKVEPIRWRIISEEDGVAFILCDSILAARRFDNDSQNYAESEIRTWLNNTFLNNAFNETENSFILNTEVDNSLASTGDASNPYICENTNDKVFLLSRTEVINAEYGFGSISSGDTARRMVDSDYARATGVYMATESGYYGNGYWWLRSPYIEHYYNNARVVFGSGFLGSDIVSANRYGVVPALRITL